MGRVQKESWRDLLLPKELAAQEAGTLSELTDGYGWRDEDGRPTSIDSRNNRLVTYNPRWEQHQPGYVGSDRTYRRSRLTDWDARGTDGNTEKVKYERVALNSNPSSADFELQAYYRHCLEAIDGFALQPASCMSCGRLLRADFHQKRITVIDHRGIDENNVVVFCVPCFAVFGISLRRDGDPLYKLSELERRVWKLYNDGWTQKQIAFSLSTPHRHLTQPKVSRILSKIRRLHSELYARSTAA
jgi:hypothetical protein